jgi:3'(2'), 5'-bisphosphate nucleotidase
LFSLWVDPVRALAQQAGQRILHEQSQGLHIVTKPDGSPQSNADRAAEDMIIAGLRQIAPHIPVIAEESASTAAAYDPTHPFWLVDPLDGTKSFLAGTDDFSVNIALVVGTRPVFGVILAPARSELFWNDAHSAYYQKGTASAQSIKARTAPATGLTMITSRRSHAGKKLRDWMAAETITEQMMMSSAIKFGYVAMGVADVYPRLGQTMEWDNAAGEAIVHTAGGKVTAPDGSPLQYGQSHLTHHGFIARGRM